MLVGYSSSSEEENDAVVQEGKRPAEEDDGCSARKKPKTQGEVPKTRLPLPGCLLTMFPEELDPQTEDRSLHGGRIRSFKHERGNWATYVYFPYQPEEEFVELLDQMVSVAKAHGVALSPQEEFHLSVSQTVVLRHHWIQPFTRSLRAGLTLRKRFCCSAERLKVYCNADRTRTFLGMEVCTGHAQLLDLVQIVDRTMSEFLLETFYKDPSFHVSLAWCVGDMTEPMRECLKELQSVFDGCEEGPFLLRLDCRELRCRTGNRIFHFPLQP
ncbi:U6 snRNA phosphodiesterase 1 isoform X2 [Takifugu flavidus]|uniref:U6 snRNA phosphodiesterase 1 isoform X2 n=1 Tax=Takifugu flavidus TaxID=433684 RepID=UPI002544A385|nr:U6 snRNA phosphodiesterase 1 isoform X2 [Takifugu flavidus]